MRILKWTGFFLACFFTMQKIAAQQKHALLIAINNYYLVPGTPDPHMSLKGCVNDAKLMKGILLTRFGFRQNEITEVYNEKATRKKILAGFNDLLAISQKGDVAFVYYSGHGLLIKNSFSDKDTLNIGGEMIGHNQGMLTTDLYDTTAVSVVRDHDISRLVNLFINKGVILTLIYDCCYSQGMLRGAEDEQDQPWDIAADIKDAEKARSVDPSQLPNIFRDTVTNHFDDSIVMEARNLPLGYYKDIRDKGRIVRPAERPDSRFLYYAASIGLDKSYERNNISNIKHGIFTQALSEVLKETPASTSLDVLQKKIADKLQKEQFIFPLKQNPNVQCDPVRLKLNLLGLPAQNLSDAVWVNCLKVNGNEIITDGGASVGLTKGNILMLTKNNITVTAKITGLTGIDSAVATIIGSNQFLIQPGVRLKVTDWYAQSEPLLKIYIPDDHISMQKLYSFYKEQVSPFKTSRKAIWFDKQDNDCAQVWCSNNYFFVNQISSSPGYPLNTFNPATVEKITNGKRFFINLPIPTPLAAEVKARLMKNQNILLVDNMNAADAYLYCGFSPVDGAFYFTLSNDLILAARNPAKSAHKVSEINAGIAQDKFVTTPIKEITDGIYEVVLQYASHSRWLNKWPRR